MVVRVHPTQRKSDTSRLNNGRGQLHHTVFTLGAVPFGNRLTAGRGPLDPAIVVRIHIPELNAGVV